MQLTQKHIIGISIGAVLALLGYLQVQNNTTSQLDGVKVNTPISQSGIETDTVKRLKTYSESGTAWNMSPFGSGKPLEEEKKPEFKKPNTEWKSRSVTLSDGRTLYYELGKGNPSGADPLSEKEKEAYKQCYYNTIVNALDCPPIASYGGGYITSDIEKSLISLLSNPLWKKVLLNCEQQFRQYEYPDWGMSYDQIMYQNAMNMENMITVNLDNGRKEIKFGTFPLIRSWFGNALIERKETMRSDSLKINNCISQNGGLELYRLIDIIYEKQFYPDWKYPDRITDSKTYIPWY